MMVKDDGNYKMRNSDDTSLKNMINESTANPFYVVQSNPKISAIAVMEFQV